MKNPENLVIRTWTEDAWAFVKKRSLTIEFSVGENLCLDGEPVTHFIFPQSGILTSMDVSQAGQSIEMHSAGREGIVGMLKVLAGGNCEGNTAGLIAGRATLVPCQHLHDAAEQFACVDASMMRYGRFAVKTLMRSIASVRSQSAEQQIALWLLMAADRLGSPDIPMTHDRLAKLLGMRRATVSTTLSKFAREGCLQTGRGVTHILNPDGLQPIAGQYYRKWHDAFEELASPLPTKLLTVERSDMR